VPRRRLEDGSYSIESEHASRRYAYPRILSAPRVVRREALSTTPLTPGAVFSSAPSHAASISAIALRGELLVHLSV